MKNHIRKISILGVDIKKMNKTKEEAHALKALRAIFVIRPIILGVMLFLLFLLLSHGNSEILSYAILALCLTMLILTFVSIRLSDKLHKMILNRYHYKNYKNYKNEKDYKDSKGQKNS